MDHYDPHRLRIALGLLQLVALVLPAIGILLQLSLRKGILNNAPEEVTTKHLFSITFNLMSLVTFVLGGILVLWYLISINRTFLISGAFAIMVALFLLLIGLLLMFGGLVFTGAKRMYKEGH